jgi:FlaG/FlaF family flagellin (archaellin)
MVAIILLVGITVVLTSVLYLVVANMTQGAEEVPPRVLLTNVGNPAGQSDFYVSAADVRPMSAFQVRLWVDGSVDDASTMSPVAAGTAGNVTYVDLDGGGTITEGDTVHVQTAPGRAYVLLLFWKSTLMDRDEWST